MQSCEVTCVIRGMYSRALPSQSLCTPEWHWGSNAPSSPLSWSKHPLDALSATHTHTHTHTQTRRHTLGVTHGFIMQISSYEHTLKLTCPQMILCQQTNTNRHIHTLTHTHTHTNTDTRTYTHTRTHQHTSVCITQLTHHN